MFSPALISRMNDLIADGEGWRVAQHDALFDEAQAAAANGADPAVIAELAAALFDLDSADERHIAAVLRDYIAEHADPEEIDITDLIAELE